MDALAGVLKLAKSITIFKKLNTNLRQTDFIVKEMDKKSDNKVHLK